MAMQDENDFTFNNQKKTALKSINKGKTKTLTYYYNFQNSLYFEMK